MITTFSNLTIHTGSEVLENHSIEIENGKIARKNPSYSHENTHIRHISSAFIDLYVNGGEKYYFTQHPTEETIGDIAQSCFKMGTGYVLPTLITSPLENILKGIESTRKYIAKNPNSGVLGMHLEEPFLNPTKRGLIYRNM